MKNRLLILALVVITNYGRAQNCNAAFSMSYDSTTNILSTIPVSNGNSIQHFWTVYLNESPPYISSPLIYLPNGGMELRCPSGQFSVQVCHRLVDTTISCSVKDCDTIIIESHRRCNPYFFSMLEPASAYYSHIGSNTNDDDIWILNGDTIAMGDTNFIAYSLIDIPTDTIMEHIVYDSLGCYSVANNNNITSINELIMPEISIYPNPTGGIVNINTKLFEGRNVGLAIINLLGQKVYTKNIKSANSIEQLDLTQLSNGIYTLIIYTGEQHAVAKIVKSM